MKKSLSNIDSVMTTEPTKATMTIIVIEPERVPTIKEISGELHELQEIVGGTTQAIYPFDDEVALLCNDDGWALGLIANRGLKDDNEEICDIICGTFFPCGAPADSDHFTSVTPDQIERFEKQFHYPEMFVGMDGHIVCLRAS